MTSLIKKTIIVAVVLAALAVAAVFGRKAYKHTMERRLIAKARQYLEKNDEREAALCLQRAVQINPASWPAAQAIADMLDNGGSPAALGWRIRAAQLKAHDADGRLAWARTALKWKDYQSAAAALTGVEESAKTSEAYHSLMGALAWAEHNGAEADKQYNEARKLAPDDPFVLLNLATIGLSSTNQAEASAARLSMEQISGSTNLDVRITALHYLAMDAEAHKAYGRALEYSGKLLQIPSAGFPDKLGHLSLLEEDKSDQFTPWLNTVKKEATQSPAKACAMGRWLAAARGPGEALRWFASLPHDLLTNAAVQISMAECQAEGRDWKGVLTLTSAEDWGDADFYRFSLQALAQRSLGQDNAGESSWRKALRQSSRHLDRIARLDQLTKRWGWNAERTEVLRRALTEFPKETWISDELMASLYAQGDTAGIQDLLAQRQRLTPSDPRIKNNLANVCLLRKTQMDTACKWAKEAYDAAPDNPFFASTYAYALLSQNKPSEALRVVDGVKSEALRIPSVAAYYGVIQARTGHKDLAREPLERAQTARLLPEEKEMVRLAKAL